MHNLRLLRQLLMPPYKVKKPCKATVGIEFDNSTNGFIFIKVGISPPVMTKIN